MCCVCGSEEVKRCGKCKMTCYCSKDCQKAHHAHHSEYCSMIVDLKIIETEKLYKEKSVRQVQVDDKLKKKLVKVPHPVFL